MVQLLKEYILGEICAQYWYDTENSTVDFEIVPNGMQSQRQPKNQKVDSCVQVMLRGDDFPFGFANGHTMHNASTVYRFEYIGQQTTCSGGETKIVTRLEDGEGLAIHHSLHHSPGAQGVTVHTSFHNEGKQTVVLDMLSSFSLAGLTPFVAGDAAESMILHRLRSKWSNEGRLESIPIEVLQLEPTWSGHGAFGEKFGQVGSMPVRRFFPFVAIEDVCNNVVWGVQLACPSSWQIEAYRRDDGLCLSGGLADYDFGHWCKQVAPGESFAAPPASLTVSRGDLEEACARLVEMQTQGEGSFPSGLPVVFNEFCTTWGEPTEKSVEAMLRVLKGRDIDYFVIDSGWYADEEKGWEMNMGDWQVNSRQFPKGLAPVARAIKNAGMRPGIWFEPEVCGRDAEAYKQTAHLLQRFGSPVTAGHRRFWNMNDSWVKAHLEERIINLIKTSGFEYVKIDYNETVGVGCDGAESLGEGLRQNIEGTQSFLKRIQENIPGIVVENCSSGGHRLEPSFTGICQLSSFSDAHEEKEIPVIAANLHRVLPPGKSLIWAVLRKGDSRKRLVWSLCATFLGVMCLSGDVNEIGSEQWAIVEQGIAFYRRVSAVIQNGRTVQHGPPVHSYRHPNGWQAVVRTSLNKKEVLVVVHAFSKPPEPIRLEIGKEYALAACFASGSDKICFAEGEITAQLCADEAFAMLLCRVGEETKGCDEGG